MDAKSITDAIMRYLDKIHVDVQILEENSMLLFRTEIADDSDDPPGTVYCVISIEDSMYTVYTSSTELGDTDSILAEIVPVSELVARANWFCVPGHFDLNEDTGDIRYKNCVYCNALPDEDSIHDNIGIAVEEIIAFTNDALKVVREHRSPKEVINQMEIDDRAVSVENDFYHFLASHVRDK